MAKGISHKKLLATPVPEEGKDGFDLVKQYQEKEEQAKKNKRTITPGKNVPYGDIKGLLDLLIAKIGKEKVDTSQASLTITAILEKRYKEMPEGNERVSIRVGKDYHEMTKSEARKTRLDQLEYSRKNNNVYRIIRQILNR
jgi:hypothetical protein